MAAIVYAYVEARHMQPREKTSPGKWLDIST
jgi:hypothetical protein